MHTYYNTQVLQLMPLSLKLNSRQHRPNQAAVYLNMTPIVFISRQKQLGRLDEYI